MNVLESFISANTSVPATTDGAAKVEAKDEETDVAATSTHGDLFISGK